MVILSGLMICYWKYLFGVVYLVVVVGFGKVKVFVCNFEYLIECLFICGCVGDFDVDCDWCWKWVCFLVLMVLCNCLVRVKFVFGIIWL